MIAHSDNNAVTLLTTHWPANESSGFQQFLADYGFAYAATCGLTPQTGIIGMASAGEFANIVSAVYDYLIQQRRRSLPENLYAGRRP